jgi:hypothetical protein
MAPGFRCGRPVTLCFLRECLSTITMSGFHPLPSRNIQTALAAALVGYCSEPATLVQAAEIRGSDLTILMPAFEANMAEVLV